MPAKLSNNSPDDAGDQPLIPAPASDARGRITLPFETTKRRKKAADVAQPKQSQSKQPKSTPQKSGSGTAKLGSVQSSTSKPTRLKAEKETPQKEAVSREGMEIPESVSRRMVSRMTLFCGLPSIASILVFVVSYTLVSHEWLKLPPIAVLLLSLGCFGLGVVGLSYGALSASWEEDIPGSRLGWAEFTTNLERMTSAWRAKGTTPEG